MSDRFQPISMEQLTDWAFTELEQKGSLFNVPQRAFFVPHLEHRFRGRVFGREIDTPFGVAAGPHTQMAQNIVAAWLAGARVIELKTVQTLDRLDLHKPCIDMQDEGYNVEWSQELRLSQSFDEYLRAWVLIHALHHRFGWPGDVPGVVFNMSVGYDLAGIHEPNVQWFLDAMADASRHLPAYVDIVARSYPAVREIDIPARLSDSVTLSTMHGCPPDEIEAISRYLLEDRGLHTLVKCNPTLLGAELVRGIVNRDLGFADVPIPDSAFEHDLKLADALPMFGRLRELARARGHTFGLKLSNTLEVENWRGVFDRDREMYMSGRPLHAVTVNLAARLAEELPGDLPLSFAGGADCFNLPDLLAAGMRTVTVCSDLLKTGGYLRLLQYPESLEAAFDAVGARDTADFACKTALARLEAADFVALMSAGDSTSTSEGYGALLASLRDGSEAESVPDRARSWAISAGADPERAGGLATQVVSALSRINLRSYAEAVRHDWRYKKGSFHTDRSKTARELRAFDCISAPCVDTCPVNQAVSAYMDAVRRGDLDEAVRIARRDNPLPSVLGRACDHLCEDSCVRTHLDQPLAIRHVKRFVMDQERTAGGHETRVAPQEAARVAIVGAGPAGLAAALELARDGFGVTVFEERSRAGGMASGAIPAYRLPQAPIDRDLAVLERLGIEFRYGMKAGTDFTLDGLRAEGFSAIFLATGAQLAGRLGLPGEDADGILDGLEFLRAARDGRPVAVGARVAVIGGGDSAMDCARVALRLGASKVSVVYRRTVNQMPADPEEIRAALDEGAEIVELARPVALHVEAGKLVGLVCVRTEFHGERDASGRKVPFDVPGSDFEIGLDTLIPSVGQRAVFDSFGDSPPELTKAGFIAVDPRTMTTSIPGVYAGGDVTGSGPASIVMAAGEGKRAARAIAAAVDHHPVTPVVAETGFAVDVHEMMLRRARRVYRVPIRSRPPAPSLGFEETVLGYTSEEARREASRCLDCQTFCSLCVSVCPNLALFTYEMDPVETSIPCVLVSGGSATPAGKISFVAGQRYQVAVLADLCNECGNCVTACPTSGAPYRDKPRLYLHPDEFRTHDSNAFLLLGRSAIEGRFDGATHRIDVGDLIEYTSPKVRAYLEKGTLELLAAVPAGAAEGEVVSLEPAAIMVALLGGLAGSRPHLPSVEETGTFMPEPALADAPS